MKSSDLKLDKEVRDLLEEELGGSVPEPNSAEFQLFLEELQAERPDLFDEVMRGLQVNVTLPAEEQAQRAERRDNVKTAVQRTFFRPSQVDGEPVTAKRRILMYVLAGAFLLMPAMYILGQIIPRESVDGQIERPELVEPILQEPNSTALQPQTVEVEPEPPADPPTPIRLPPPPRTVEAAAPPAPKPATPSPTPPQPVAQPAQVQPAPAPRAAPQPEEPLPSSLSVFQQQEQLPNQLQVFAQPEQPQAATGLSIFAADDSLPSSLSVGTVVPDGVERPGDLSIASAPPEAPPEDTVLFDINDLQAETEPLDGQNTNGQPEPLTEPVEAAPETEAPVEAAAEPQGLEEGFLFTAGTRVPAELVTGVLVAQGSSIPVVATTAGNWCVEASCPEITWIGRATLDGLDRVQITVEQSLMNGQLKTAQALGLDLDAAPGLTAEIRDESPSFVENLLANSLGGVSDYVAALTRQQKVTVIDGVALSETQVPDVDAFILGRVASMFSAPQRSADGQQIRVAEIPAGTPLFVLYGVGRSSISQ